MKKEELIVIRTLSAAGLLAVLAVLVFLFAGSNIYTGVVSDINSNVIDAGSEAGSIYNMYFYKGLGVVYRILYSITLFGTITGALALVFRHKGAASLGFAGAVSGVITGVYMLLTVIFEGNVWLHSVISYMYLGEWVGNIETAHILGVKPVIVGIFMAVVGLLALLLIKTSGVKKLKAYSCNTGLKGFYMLMPAFIAVLVMELLRNVVLNIMCNNHGQISSQVYTYIFDYLFANAWGINFPYIWWVMFAASLIIIITAIVKMPKIKKNADILVTLVMGVVAIIRAVIWWYNPPRLFGYLTFDEHICDITESASIAYLLVFVTDIVLLVSMSANIFMAKSNNKKIAIIALTNIVISAIALAVALYMGIVASLYISVLANIAAMVVSVLLAQEKNKDKN